MLVKKSFLELIRWAGETGSKQAMLTKYVLWWLEGGDAVDTESTEQGKGLGDGRLGGVAS